MDRHNINLPHACGDEPKWMHANFPALYICPTHVGMNRKNSYTQGSKRNLPHACGDEPHVDRLRGSSIKICPTHVGMNRRYTP